MVIITVDSLLFTVKDNTLCVVTHKRLRGPFEGLLALPGGYIHEDVEFCHEDTLKRILQDKIQMTGLYVEQFGTYAGRLRDPRGWSSTTVYMGLVPYAKISHLDGNVIVVVDVAKIVDGGISLAFDHAKIVADGISRLRSKSHYSSLPAFLCDTKFTIPELKRYYEVIRQESIPRTTFDRLMEKLDILEKADGLIQTGPNRPAEAYKLKSQYLQSLSYIG